MSAISRQPTNWSKRAEKAEGNSSRVAACTSRRKRRGESCPVASSVDIRREEDGEMAMVEEGETVSGEVEAGHSVQEAGHSVEEAGHSANEVDEVDEMEADEEEVDDFEGWAGVRED